MPARRLYDTSVYITALRQGVASPAAQVVQENLPQTVVAAVVVAELRAGARTPAARRLVDDLVHWAQRVNRLETPTATDWERAGTVLGAIRAAEPTLRSKVPTLWNDALIAATARRIGATVVTHNAADFRLLARHLPFQLVTL